MNLYASCAARINANTSTRRCNWTVRFFKMLNLPNHTVFLDVQNTNCPLIDFWQRLLISVNDGSLQLDSLGGVKSSYPLVVNHSGAILVSGLLRVVVVIYINQHAPFHVNNHLMWPSIRTLGTF